MINRYAGYCAVCGGHVPAKGGNLTRNASGAWQPVHLACADGKPSVIETRFSTGAVVTVNVNGRCEDAPCCGCCS